MSPMVILTRILFGLAVVGGLVGIVLGLVGPDLSPWRLEANWRHIFLLIGLVVLFLGNFAYYMGPIENAGPETPSQTLLSVVGMLVMAALPMIVLSADFAPWRYLAIAVYGVLVVAKNVNLSHRLDAPAAQRLSRLWTRRAILQTALCFSAGALYFALIEPGVRSWLFQRLVDAPVLAFKPAFANAVHLVFSVSFLAIVVAMYVMNQKDLDELKSAGTRSFRDLKLTPTNAMPPRGRNVKPDDHP